MPALRRLSPLLWLGPAIALIGLVVLLTLLSIGFYLAEWLRHMNSFGTGH